MISLSDPRFPWPRWIGIKHIKEVTLGEDLFVEQWIVPKGTRVRVFQGQNFGYCIMPPGVMPCGIKPREGRPGLDPIVEMNMRIDQEKRRTK
jgi:hypothetical protein